MNRNSHTTVSASSHVAGLVACFLAVWPWTIGSVAAAEVEILDERIVTGEPKTAGGPKIAGELAIIIDEAQVMRIQDVMVGAPVSGLVAKVRIQEGQAVSVDTVLVELSAERAEKELAAAQAAYEAALIQSENDVNTRYAQRTLEVRKRELKQSTEANQRYAGSVTATEIDRLQLVIDQAILSVEQAQQELDVATATVREKAATVDLAALRVREHSIGSLTEGRIAEVLVQAGQWVEAGKPVVRIVSLDPIRISAFIDGRKHNRSLVGRPVEFQWQPEPSVPAITLMGRVSFVSDELNPVTSQVRLWAEVDNPDETIRPGMRGMLVIQPSGRLPLPNNDGLDSE